MDYRAAQHTLEFKFNAGTSRGVLQTKDSWFIQLIDGQKTGVGECGILKGLSIENFSTFGNDIKNILNVYTSDSQMFKHDLLTKLPSLSFGLEMAEMDLANSGSGILFDNGFTRGMEGIPINGLVWMGDYQFMYDQIYEKIEQGYSCIKLKIGAIDFAKEIELLKYIRNQFDASDIEIRVDANGAFAVNEALEKLKILSTYDLHSIEQPIRQGQWQEMAKLCEDTPLPIALDEELIVVTQKAEKHRMLETISPQYIILKPSLIGGYKACEEWMQIADEVTIGYWVTSALESNIGLNAIAQWTYEKNIHIPQGLGTGQLYYNNFEGPLYVKNGHLHFNPEIGVYENFNFF